MVLFATQTQSGWWFDEQRACDSFNLNQPYPLSSSVALGLSAFVQIETSIKTDPRLPTLIDPCEDISIQSIQSNNDMSGRRYVWKTSQNITQYLVNQNNKTLIVPNQFIPTNENVTISLFIYALQGNQLSESNSLTFFRRKAIAKIELSGTGTLSVKDTGSLSLFAYLTEIPSCLVSTKKTWFIQGQSYSTTLNYLSFTVKAAGSISVQIVSDHLEAIRSVPVTVIETKPNAVISGGNRMVLAGNTILLDASQSSDPLYGSITGAIYKWSCDSCSKQLPSGVTTLLDEGPGNYTISLMYTPNPFVTNRVGNASIIIQIVNRESVIPVLKISSVVPTILNPLKVLRISANVSNIIGGYGVEWSVRADSSQSVIFMRTYSTLIPLVIPEYTLKYNNSYTFMIRARCANVASGQLVSFASVTSRTSAPPIITGVIVYYLYLFN